MAWQGVVRDAWERQRNLLPAQDGTSDPNANFGVDDVTPNYSTSASVDYTPAGWAYLSFRGGYFARDSYNEGVYQGDRFVYQTPSLGLPGVPPQYQQPRGYMNVPSNLARDRARGPRLGIQVDGTASVRWQARISSRRGVQVDRLGLDALSGGTGNNMLFFWGLRLAGAAGPYGYYEINSNTRLPNRGFIREGEATVTNIGLFVQDAVAYRPAAHRACGAAHRKRDRALALARPEHPVNRDRLFVSATSWRRGWGLPGTSPATGGPRRTAPGGSSTTSPSCRSRSASARSTRW